MRWLEEEHVRLSENKGLIRDEMEYSEEEGERKKTNEDQPKQAEGEGNEDVGNHLENQHIYQDRVEGNGKESGEQGKLSGNGKGDKTGEGEGRGKLSEHQQQEQERGEGVDERHEGMTLLPNSSTPHPILYHDRFK